jgi:hypothetical protein
MITSILIFLAVAGVFLCYFQRLPMSLRFDDPMERHQAMNVVSTHLTMHVADLTYGFSSYLFLVGFGNFIFVFHTV